MTQVSVNNCLPPVGPCHSPITPLFAAGVPIRQVPLCVDPTCECPQLAYGRALCRRRDRSEWLKGWIIAQITTRGEVSCDEHPLKVRAGGCWADSFRSPAGFRSGSKLWALQWSFVTNESLIAAKQ